MFYTRELAIVVVDENAISLEVSEVVACQYRCRQPFIGGTASDSEPHNDLRILPATLVELEYFQRSLI